MTQETLKKAKALDEECKNYCEILDVLEHEKNHWWAFKAPDSDKIEIPHSMRNKFKSLVEECYQETLKEIEEL